MTITFSTMSILAGVYGFYGNTKENKYILLTYAIVLAVIIFAEFTAGIMALVYQDKCKCCGADGPSDWLYSYYYLDTGYNVPNSCCREGLDGTCQDDSYYSSTIYQEGCTVNAGDWIQKNLVIVGATCLGVIPIHGIAILAVVCVQKLVVYPNRLL
ncbi:CD63 antigen-like isoform X2 [Anneissia japonica]|nr:CD63 antigen-like isoform X2 [Anneissia japonica]